jgi:putative DNA primase/helicase
LSKVGTGGGSASARQSANGEVKVNEAADDPHRLARVVIQSRFKRGELSTLVYHRGQFSRWKSAAYRAVADHEVGAWVTAAIRKEYERINRIAISMWEKRDPAKGDPKKPSPKPMMRKVTRGRVGDTTQAMKGMTLLEGDTESPAWLIDKPPFDAKDVLPCQNSLIHLPSFVEGKPNAIIPATPAFFCPYSLTYDFVRSAPPPVALLAFLRSVWPKDQESIDTLQEWFGYLLSPDTSQHKILLMVGPRRSGRGTIGRLIEALLGAENVAGPTLMGLTTNFGLSPLIGKPAAIVGDARVAGRAADWAAIVERLLSISGEDAITIDRKHIPPWTGMLPTRLTIMSNELPRLPDQAGALVGRYLLLRFTESFYGKEDHQLGDKLAAELPSILLWAIEGWKRLRARGHFVQPKSGQGDLDTVADLSSPVGAYARERIKLKPGSSSDVERVFSDWRDWCAAKNREPGDALTFGRNLRTVFPNLETKQRREFGTRVRYYEGLTIDPS